MKKLVPHPVILNQNKYGLFHRIQTLCKPEAFDSVAESLSSDGGCRFVTWFRIVKTTWQNILVDHRELVSVVAAHCWGLAVYFNGLSNSSLESVIIFLFSGLVELEAGLFPLPSLFLGENEFAQCAQDRTKRAFIIPFIIPYSFQCFPRAPLKPLYMWVPRKQLHMGQKSSVWCAKRWPSLACRSKIQKLLALHNKIDKWDGCESQFNRFSLAYVVVHSPACTTYYAGGISVAWRVTNFYPKVCVIKKKKQWGKVCFAVAHVKNRGTQRFVSGTICSVRPKSRAWH